MLTVNSCFGFDLDKGGKIIGWLGKICSGIGAILFLIAFISLAFISCQQLHQKESSCSGLKIGIAIACILLIGAYIGIFYIFHIFLIGLEQRNHQKIFPALICEIVTIALSIILTFWSLNVWHLIFNLVSICLAIYFTIVIYSIYTKIKNEKTSNSGV